MCFPVKELGGATLRAGGAAAPIRACAKQTLDTAFPFFPQKRKSSSDLFQLAEVDMYVGLSLKPSGGRQTFEKRGIPVVC